MCVSVGIPATWWLFPFNHHVLLIVSLELVMNFVPSLSLSCPVSSSVAGTLGSNGVRGDYRNISNGAVKWWWETGESLGLVRLLLQEPHKAQWFPFSGLSMGMGFDSHAFIHPPPGFPLKLGSCHGTLSPKFLFLPCLVVLGWDVTWCSAKLNLQERSGTGSRRVKGLKFSQT